LKISIMARSSFTVLSATSSSSASEEIVTRCVDSGVTALSRRWITSIRMNRARPEGT
jgi:hypothetical protein